MSASEDTEPEEWSSHYFPAPSSNSGRGGKKGGFKKVGYCIDELSALSKY